MVRRDQPWLGQVGFGWPRSGMISQGMVLLSGKSCLLFPLLKEAMMNIEFSEHACLRFIERINPNLHSIIDYRQRLNAVEKVLNSILQDARYISDDERGVLLRSATFNCDIILHNRRLITIYPCKSKNKNGHAERSRGTVPKRNNR